ncbi:MAG: hypothetical protein QXH55_03760, partial [Candidatus Korarchaeota archaeon]
FSKSLFTLIAHSITKIRITHHEHLTFPTLLDKNIRRRHHLDSYPPSVKQSRLLGDPIFRLLLRIIN